ncbi:MAG TPA: phosphotransacetylase family protein [Thermodesulfovibrionales bacterium]|nr:phosphotransacetylase family protein [Thermodesulfovibrionales bacterium]
MIPVFIVSNRSYSGKTFIALGLALALREQGYRVGYIKPIGKTPVKKNSNVYDADAVFIKEALSLPEALDIISPLVLTYETQNLIFQGKIKDAKKKILGAFRALGKKDFVIIGGGADLFDGALLHINALSLVAEMKAHALIVESWMGDGSMDSLMGASCLLGMNCAGSVINRVPVSAFGHVSETVKPFMEKKGVKIFGIFQRDSLLESLTIRQLIEILHGKVLCSEDRLDEFVENFSIGAMDVDSALKYFRRIPNKAVITGAHRSDIQLAAIETSTKCIILTGGLYTNDVIIGKAEAKGIPIISVAEDTFAAVDRIEAIMGKTRIADKVKIERAKDLIRTGFNLKRFLRAAS